MRREVLDPCHPNPGESGDRAGHGRNLVTMVFDEHPGTGEGVFRSPLHHVIDSTLEPGAAIGLHSHDTDEEIYYLLDGELTMTTVDGDRESTETLGPGDAHAVRLGQSHFGVAGDTGARFVVIAVRPS
jgi:quercetin dioxygenase-like cupin family protein